MTSSGFNVPYNPTTVLTGTEICYLMFSIKHLKCWDGCKSQGRFGMFYFGAGHAFDQFIFAIALILEVRF